MTKEQYSELVELKKKTKNLIKKITGLENTDIGVQISIYNLKVTDEIWNEEAQDVNEDKDRIYFSNHCFSEINIYSESFYRGRKFISF